MGGVVIEGTDVDTGKKVNILATADGELITGFKRTAAKTRHAIAVGFNKKEVKFAPGDNITQCLIGADWTSGSVTTGAQQALVCFDATPAAAVTLIGADGTATAPESLDANLNMYKVPVGSFLLVGFSEPGLSYAANVGFLGNAWVRAIDNANPIDIILMGAS